MIFKKEIADEQCMRPKWYWGETYKENNRLVTICHIIPLNLIIRFVRKIYWALFFFTNTKDFRYYYKDGWKTGYNEGFEDGRIHELRSDKSIFGILKADLKTINQHIRQEKFERRCFMDKVKKYGIYILCIGIFIAMLIVAMSTLSGCGLIQKTTETGQYGQPITSYSLNETVGSAIDCVAPFIPYGGMLTTAIALLGLRRKSKDFAILSEGVNTALDENPAIRNNISLSLERTMDKYKVRERFKKYKDKMLKK